jgi:FAD/FMN-containing dehydrogenase
MNTELTSGDHLTEVKPGDPRYRDLQLRGYNRRFVGAPGSVLVVDGTDQVVAAVDAAVASGKKLAVRSGGHCVEGLVDDPAVGCVVDLGRMDSLYYDHRRRAFAVQAGAPLGRVYQALDLGWGVTLPGGSCTGVGMGGHVTGGGFGPLSRSYGLVSDHLYAVETVVVDEHAKATAVTATREEDDPHRELWWAHAGGGGGNSELVRRNLEDPDTDLATAIPTERAPNVKPTSVGAGHRLGGAPAGIEPVTPSPTIRAAAHL